MGAIPFFLPCLLVAGLAASLARAGATEPAPDLARLFERAEVGARPVFLRMDADWCALCHRMESTTYRAPEVVLALGGFVLARVDADDDALLARRFGVETLPLALVLDDEGREIARFTGWIDAAALTGRLLAASAGYARYLSDREMDRDADALARVGDYLASVGNGADAARWYARALRRVDGENVTRRDELRIKLTAAKEGRSAGGP